MKNVCPKKEHKDPFNHGVHRDHGEVTEEQEMKKCCFRCSKKEQKNFSQRPAEKSADDRRGPAHNPLEAIALYHTAK